MAEREMLRYWVWLLQVFGAGSTKALRHLHEYESPREIYEAYCAGRLEGLTPHMLAEAEKFTLERADSLVHVCDSEGIRFVTIQDDDYPEILRGIHAPPYLLTAKGNTALLKEPLTLAIVGTRHPTLYSQKVVSEVVRGLGSNRFVIVSGFANGIDTAAHTAALDFGYATIAVLGCGINVDYPRENIRLRERMITSGRGLLLSEYLPGTRPSPANFPKRNRILSGLAYATAVIEAAYGSGSLLTAECAEDQGRYLLCVPPPDIFDARYRGVFPLLRNGAAPLLSANDVLAVFFDGYAERLRLPQTPVRPAERLVYASEQPEKKQHPGKQGSRAEAEPAAEQLTLPAKETHPKTPQKAASLPPADPAPETPPRTDLPEDEEGAAIVRYLRTNGGTDVDKIAEDLDLDLSSVLSTLMLLELKGFVTSLFGKQYYPAE